MLQKLSFRPGINRENTIYATEGGWYDMDKVRFRFGTPEKIGGWKNAVSGTFRGVARNLMCWSTLAGETVIGVGTDIRYYINYGAQYYNITPLRATATYTNPLNTTINTSVVRVFATAHGAVAGDYVIFTGVSTFAGINAAVWGRADGHRIVSIIDANTYTIDVGTVATLTTTAGGTFTAAYEMRAGRPVFSLGGGWGAGYWNAAITNGTAFTEITGGTREALSSSATTINVASTVGFAAAGALLVDAEVITYTAITATSFTGCLRGQEGSTACAHNRRQLDMTNYADVVVRQIQGYAGTNGWGKEVETTFGDAGIQMRLWSATNFGQDLVMAPRGGSIYYWTKDVLTFNRAVALRDPAHATKKFVPHTVNYMMVSDVSRFVMALGANPYLPANENSVFDPMLVRWSAQNDPGSWIPSATNQSGEIRLSAGSYIMCGLNTKQEMLIWTDAALYSMQYIGPPYVWKTELSMSNVSLMGPNAVTVVNNSAYWMGTDKFYIYNGRVDTLPCTIQQYIFNDISFGQRFQAFAGTNEGFNEIWWFYVSGTEVAAAASQSRDPTVDKYVVFNHAEQCWYYGTLNRTAWLDTPLQPGPLACTGDSNNGTLVMHEQGTDDGTSATSAPLSAYIQSSDFDIGDGHQYLFVWRMLPDVSFNGSISANPSCTVTLLPRENTGSGYSPGDPTTVTSAQLYSTVVKQYTVQQFTPQINTRVRGRAMAFRIESNEMGVQWKLGVPRIDARPDGRKS